MAKISVKGVLIGSITDIVLTIIFVVPLMLYVVIAKNLVDVPPEQLEDALIAAFESDIFLFSVCIILGSLASVIGGYTAAAIAKHHQLLNGGCSAFLCIAFTVYSLTSGASPLPIWMEVGFIPLSPMLGMLGGYLHLRRSLRQGSSSGTDAYLRRSTQA